MLNPVTALNARLEANGHPKQPLPKDLTVLLLGLFPRGKNSALHILEMAVSILKEKKKKKKGIIL